MPIVLVTGMSGAGKSTVLSKLAQRGHRTVETDYGDWCEVAGSESGAERIWREDRITDLWDGHTDGALFVSGTVANQGRFYARLDAVVLLSAPLPVLLERVDTRVTNGYGKSADERRDIIHHTYTVEPMLRAGATHEIDTRRPISAVADELEAIAGAARSSRP